MVRVYKHKIGIHFMNYREETLKNALADIKSGKKTIRQAAECYKIPKSTLHDKIKKKKTKKHGGQTKLSSEEEKMIADGIIKFCEWGFPMTRGDIRLLVKGYLYGQGKKIKIFKDNFPGPEWFYKFLQRQNILTERFAQNIKRYRANISKEIITEYFQNLEESLDGVEPTHIVNYDETNLTHDPGRQKVLCRRGSKRVERIMDVSKSSTSVMMAITAAGHLQPPYVVYKAVHLYPTWIEDGPEGAMYNRTKSGWFDAMTFEDWFDKIILPYFRNLLGKKVLIGDNLESHISLHVLEACEQHSINFVLLPPNGTHLLQPLDVAFFAPMKKAWREILREWKNKNRGCIPKSDFPRLFNKCIKNIENIENNIKSGFRGCGIIPLDPNVVLSKIPDVDASQEQDQRQNEKHWTTTLQEFLKESRLAATQDLRPKRGKKLKIAPGKSIGRKDLEAPSTSCTDHINSDLEKKSFKK
ncbi:hypothetical protein PPYR_01840 [Photinus pyralis]|uniref:HTH psq-type domain-containing protein n=1 Tax=Photinus pyralis TaxID=7054 RepID=A0A5N4B686_PHOPY|nr:hypothetical protein PPYR_01840 [Photinus pyralis]